MMDKSAIRKILLIENQYFPCINWIKYSFSNTYINLFSFEQYRKMSFRNRCVVAGSNGLVQLSVPVENGRNQRVPFKDVRISHRDNWQAHHWRTLTSCYNKSAYFEFYRDKVEELFSKKETFLFDLDIKILNWLSQALRIDFKIVVIEDVELAETSGYTDLRDKWLPRNFQDGDLPDGDKTSTPFPKYFQVFENRIGFQPNLSILDLLFNEGPNAAELLRDTVTGRCSY